VIHFILTAGVVVVAIGLNYCAAMFNRLSQLGARVLAESESPPCRISAAGG